MKHVRLSPPGETIDEIEGPTTNRERLDKVRELTKGWEVLLSSFDVREPCVCQTMYACQRSSAYIVQAMHFVFQY